MKMTSAHANKLVKTLNDQRNYWLGLEKERNTYIITAGEEPIIPDYDYDAVSKRIEDLGDKICIIKHAINVINSTETVEVNGENMTIDTILVKLPLLQRRKDSLDEMRRKQKKERYGSRHRYFSSDGNIEYECANFDVDTVIRDYDILVNQIMSMQMALDHFNQTVEFEVDVEI